MEHTLRRALIRIQGESSKRQKRIKEACAEVLGKPSLSISHPWHQLRFAYTLGPVGTRAVCAHTFEGRYSLNLLLLFTQHDKPVGVRLVAMSLPPAHSKELICFSYSCGDCNSSHNLCLLTKKTTCAFFRCRKRCRKRC